MNPKSIQDYSKLAEDYDEERYVLDDDAFIDVLRKERFNKLLMPKEKMSLLDVGTGTGSGILFFSKEAKIIIGLDGTKEMLDIAQKKLKDEDIENSILVNANALEMPFEDEEFDAVISLNFIHLFKPVTYQAKFLKEMARVVKKDGKVIIEIDNILYYKTLGNKFRDILKIGKYSTRLKVKKVIGISLPLTKRLFRLNKKLARMYSKLAEIFPFKYFVHRWVVKYEKI